MVLCENGCGRDAIHYSKYNTRWVCSINPSGCLAVREKIRLSLKNRVLVPAGTNDKCKCGKTAKYIQHSIPVCSRSGCGKNRGSIPLIETENTKEILCSFGCGVPGKYLSPNGIWFCQSNSSKCPSIKKRISSRTKSGSHTGTNKASAYTDGVSTCDYGCGTLVNFIFKNGKKCCSETIKKCKSHRQKLRLRTSTNLLPKSSSEPKVKNICRVLSIVPYNPSKLLTLQRCSYGCGNKANYYFTNGKWCCSEHRSGCSYFRNISSIAAKRNGLGGYKKWGGNGKRGYYKGIWCDSSYELAWVIFHLDQGTNFVRCKDKFKYFCDGRYRTYLPDFKVGDFWVEIKGYYTNNWVEKSKQFPCPDKLVVLYEKDIQQILDYARSKYGKEYWKIYEKSIVCT